MTGLEFARGVLTRVSKRGLIIAVPGGETVLFEHPLAAELPHMLATRPEAAELATELGPPLQPDAIEDLLAAGILTHLDDLQAARSSSRVQFTRSGVLLPGIAVPARAIDRYLTPALTSKVGLTIAALLVVAGVGCLAAGAPDVAPPTANPATQALLLLTFGLLTSAMHELSHAVALVHFGRSPRRAGLGFYWGAVSFYVDSTPALTLPRKQRVIQALAGLATDTVTTSVFAIAAHSPVGPLLATVCWQRAVLDAVAIAINAAPILEVDGHWALADYLDEPDLAPRARGALAELLHGRRPAAGLALAGYGAVSLVAGIGLLVASGLVIWRVLGELITALFTGSVGDVLIGIYLVGPLLVGAALSTVGLIAQSAIASAPAAPHTGRG